MLIQGIGDEVIAALVVLLFVGLVSILWLSTHVTDRPPVRAVVIRASSSAPAPSAVNSSELLDAIEATEEATTDAIEDVSTPPPPSPSDDNDENPEPSGEDSILATIKVRFTNETSLEIRERLSEKLGQFISKHLDRHLNLTNEDRVRLIYNGRVLGRDQSTLAELGLKDNCVIHCLVQRSVTGEALEAERNVRLEDPLDLDLSNVCYPLLGTVLFIIWWCQVVYAHYFNFTSTMSLVSLTILFFASMANTYFVRA